MNQTNSQPPLSASSVFRHDLRNKLTGVKSVLSFIIEGHAGEVSAKCQDLLERAYQANEEALKLTSQLESISKPSS